MSTQTTGEGDLAIGSQLQLHRPSASDFLTSQSGPTLARVGDRLFLLGGALNPGSVQSLVNVAAKSAEQKDAEASGDKLQDGKDKGNSSSGDDKPAAAPASPARPAPAPAPATPFIWEVRNPAPCLTLSLDCKNSVERARLSTSRAIARPLRAAAASAVPKSAAKRWRASQRKRASQAHPSLATEQRSQQPRLQCPNPSRETRCPRVR